MPYRLLWAVSALTCFLMLTSPRLLHAQDWPQFRGPTGQGIGPATALPIQWSDTKNVAWKQPIPGTGWSSPILFGGNIFLTTSVPQADKNDQSLRVLCLQAKTGKLLWDREVFKQDG